MAMNPEVTEADGPGATAGDGERIEGGSGAGGARAEAKRLLVVADEEIDGGDFRDALIRHLGGHGGTVEIFLVAPAIPDSGLEFEMAAGVDVATERAEKRLESLLSELNRVGIEAVGEVGDSDPVVAIGDGLREYPAEEIVVVTHPKGEAEYAEKNLVEKVHAEFSQPSVILTVHGPDKQGDSAEGGEAPPHLIDATEHEGGPVAMEPGEMTISDNMPPLRKLDLIGIVMGIVGTLVLAILASTKAVEDGNPISGAAAAMVLITIGAFLLNVAHTVGLVFFQSVRYQGIWEKFMARIAIVVTGGGLIASLILLFFF